MKRSVILISLCCTILLSSCQVNSITPTHSPAVQASPSIISLDPTQPSITEYVPTMTAAVTPDALKPTLTATFPVDTRLTLQCLEVADNLPPGYSSSGTVIFQTFGGRPGPHIDLFLHDMVDNSVTNVTINDFNHAGSVVSPDKTQIAYIRVPADEDGNPTRDSELVIATMDDTRLSTMPWERDWITIEGWTSDRRLVIHAIEFGSSVNEDSSSGSYYLVVDPFTGSQEDLFKDFPGFFNPQLGDGTSDWWGVSYSPDLTRAVYLRYLPDDPEMFTYAVWDLENQQLLATMEGVYTYFTVFGTMASRPVWSPDGSYFALIGLNMDPPEGVEYSEYELFRVSRDGAAEQLTHLSPVAVLQGLRFSWSPDGQKIALILDTWYDTRHSHIALLDIETLEVIDYCVSLTGAYEVKLIWSPDSKQFIAYSQVEWDQNGQSILIDIDGGFAARLADDLELVGWMVSP